MAQTQEKTPEQLAQEALEAEVKDLLKRYKLKRALVDHKTGAAHFDENHIKRLDAQKFTEITLG